MKVNNVTPVATDTPKSGDPTTQLIEEIAAKTKKYDPSAGQDGEAEFDTTEKIGWWGMIARERSGID
jgi:hypothetical protein